MKISTRGRYGVRLLIDLATHTGEGHVSLGSVAERQHISARYLEQVAVLLKRAGFIRSIKGASGGYTLAMAPVDILIGDVLRVLEGSMCVVDPHDVGENETPYQRCIRETVFERLNQRILSVIDSRTLASVLGNPVSGDQVMYFI